MDQNSSSESWLFFTILAGATIDFRRSNIGTSIIAAFFSLGWTLNVRKHGSFTPELIIRIFRMATLAQGITYHDGFRKTGGWAFYIHPGLHWSWTELQAYNMIPFHGFVRASERRSPFFSFLGCLACGATKTSCTLAVWWGKVFRVGRERIWCW